MPPLAEEIFEKYPFLSLVEYSGMEYIGIIQNQDDSVFSIYDYALVPDESKQKFLECGDIWWWESNRMLPINLFLKQDFVQFRVCLRTFIQKDVNVVKGPTISLAELAKKRRTKRRNIQLVKKVK
tara:strand:- start:1633 stop:2007 length:375 start_codon:yes stop_codon:yes gene_type:complete